MSSGQLEGKVAIITGAGGGIGRITALVLAREGACVTVAEINESLGQETVAQVTHAGGQSLFVRTDISQEADVRAMIAATVEKFGGLDILVNNAAAGSPKDQDILSMDVEVWDYVMLVNTRGPMLGCKHAIPEMLKRGGGAIVNIASGSALTGQLGLPAYSAAKAATISLTRSVATLYGQQGIRCNAIAPGLIMHGRLAPVFPAEHLQIDAENVLTPYQGTPDDIAKAVVFLASDNARFINAHVLPVDGGLLAHTPTFAQARALGQQRVAYDAPPA
ncbi:MAG: short-chain dehydrogenase/reductase [Deltaproteobacteria bacterium]|jgi:NAD(P)-dependent dehydrogenase (short-subunit alcohol dehydrogenase family)|nr:short-chain dehydrogenase/reductase [Deltaproteobacteria bacterium]